MTTRIRHHIIGATTLTAFLLYLDRICMAEIVKLTEFKSALNLTDEDVGKVLSAFFFAYALAQVPAGWLSDRFGARTMLPLYVSVWSLCTVLTGLANGIFMLLAARLLFGFAQAGCYPTAGSLIKRWTPIAKRGTASSLVSFGGRLGGALSPILTAWLLKDVLSWQGVLTLYGIAGFLVAFHFWRVFRETPEEHPHCDDDERALIAKGELPVAKSHRPEFPPVMQLIKSPTMWLMCALQFGINSGWVFLVTWLPTYLQDVKGVDPAVGGMMSTTVLFAGIVGMLCGGPLADVAMRVLGHRWGRSVPLVACCAVASGAYISCLYLESAWAFIVAASLVAFMTDLTVPTIWSYMQDVGGKNTAAVFGWGNMWGNFGGATTPLIVPYINKYWDTNGDWHEVLMVLAGGFLLAGVAALGIDANRKICD